jgi:hypothetical protein
VTPLDPLIIINHINSHGSGPVMPGEGESGGDMDVDGDGRVSPLDILIIINAINSNRHEMDGKQGARNSGTGRPPGGEGEGGDRGLLLPSMMHEDENPFRKNRRR